MPTASPTPDPPHRDRLEFLALAIVVVLVALSQALRSLPVIYPDGVAYLDLSDRLLAGDWQHFAQPYWSPVFPALIAAARVIFGAGASADSGIIHGLTFAFAVATLPAWWWLLRECDETLREISESQWRAFRSPALRVATHSAYVWATLWYAPPSFLTPDLLLAALMFAAGALLLRVRRTGQGAFALGGTLGVAYLVKFAALPIGLVIIALASLHNRTLDTRRLARSLAVLAAVVLPWVAVLSASAGHPELGSTARLNYAWFVAKSVAQTPHANEAPGAGRWVRVLKTPPVFDVASGGFGTYPPWADPTHWVIGARATLSAASQLRALRHEGWQIASALALLWLTIGVLSLVQPTVGTPRASLWPLGLVGGISLAMYAMVHVDGRFFAPVVPLLGAAMLARLAAAHGRGGRSGKGITIGCVIFAVTTVAPTLAREPFLWGVKAPDFPPPLAPLEFADTLAVHGVQPGFGIAVVGPVFPATGMLRRARQQVVAEVPLESIALFWKATARDRDCALATMHALGARAVLAVEPIPVQLPAGWKPLGEGMAVLLLPAAPSCASP